MKILNHDAVVKKYPDCPKEVPDELLNNDWAMKIHGQTLTRLNQRGGLSPSEIILNIEKLSDRVFATLKEGDCVKKLNEYLKAHAV